MVKQSKCGAFKRRAKKAKRMKEEAERITKQAFRDIQQVKEINFFGFDDDEEYVDILRTAFRSTPFVFEKRMNLYKYAAEKGIASAQYYYGVCYDNKPSATVVDKEAAQEWYSKSAKQG